MVSWSGLSLAECVPGSLGYINCTTVGEAAVACEASKSALTSQGIAAVCEQKFGNTYFCHKVGNNFITCGNGSSTYNYHNYTESCPTDSGYSWFGSADACGDDYCGYSSTTHDCIGEFCYNEGYGTGQICSTPGDQNSPEGCSIQNGTVVCDCGATPDAWFCPGGGGGSNQNCTTVGTTTTCYDAGDPNNPNNFPDPAPIPNPISDPNLPPPAPLLPDGDDQTTSTNKDDTDIGSGIITAINQTTAAVNVNTQAEVGTTNAVNMAAYSITNAIESINLNDSAVTAAILAQTQADLAIAEARRLNDIALNLDTTNALDAASMQAQADIAVLNATLIANGLQANADAALIAAKAQGTTDAVNIAAVAAAAAFAANTDAINAASLVADDHSQAAYNAVIDAAVQAALDAANIAAKQGETTQAVLDLINETAAEAANSEATFASLLAAQNETTLAVQQAASDLSNGLGEKLDSVKGEITKNCNPLTNSECPFVSTASASFDCLVQPACSGSPTECAMLAQTWALYCKNSVGADPVAETNYSQVLNEIRDRLPDPMDLMSPDSMDLILSEVSDTYDVITNVDGSYYAIDATHQGKLDELRGYLLSEFNTATNSIFVTQACPVFEIPVQQAGFTYTLPFSDTVGRYVRAIFAFFLWAMVLYISWWNYVNVALKQ